MAMGSTRIVSGFAININHEHEHKLLEQEIEALENSMEAMLQKMERMEQNLMEPLKKAIALGATKAEIEKNIIEPLVLQALSHGHTQPEVQSGPSIPGIQVVPVIRQSKANETELQQIPGSQIVPVIRQSGEQIDANEIQRIEAIPEPQRIVPVPQIISQIPEDKLQTLDIALGGPQPGQQFDLWNDVIPDQQQNQIIDQDTVGLSGPQPTQQFEWIDVIPENSAGPRSSTMDGSDLIQAFPVAILRYRVSYPENGRFQYEYETENGIKQRTEGYPGSQGQSNMRGAFSWPMEDGGGVASFSYEADENGYRVQSNMLPVGPPAPPHVAGLIAMAKEQRANGIVFN